MNNQFELLIIACLIIVAILIIAFGIASFVYNMKLFFYLNKNRHDRWCHLTSLGPIGPGMSNPFRWFPYLYNDSDNDESTIRLYKKKVCILLN